MENMSNIIKRRNNKVLSHAKNTIVIIGKVIDILIRLKGSWAYTLELTILYTSDLHGTIIQTDSIFVVSNTYLANAKKA